MKPTDRFGLPLVILAGLWGSFDVVLKVFVILNRQRDLFFALKSSLSGQNRSGLTPAQIFFSDWLPMWLGIGLFLFIICAVFWLLPRFFESEAADDERRIKLICRLAFLLPAFGIVGWLVGGIIDMNRFYKGG
jgi:Na+/proline symporter